MRKSQCPIAPGLRTNRRERVAPGTRRNENRADSRVRDQPEIATVSSNRGRDDGTVAPYQYLGSARPAAHRLGRSGARYMDCGKLRECWCSAPAASPLVARAHKRAPGLPGWNVHLTLL